MSLFGLVRAPRLIAQVSEALDSLETLRRRLDAMEHDLAATQDYVRRTVGRLLKRVERDQEESPSEDPKQLPLVTTDQADLAARFRNAQLGRRS